MPPLRATRPQPKTSQARQSNTRTTSQARPSMASSPLMRVEHRPARNIMSTVAVALDVEHERVLLHVAPDVVEHLRLG